MSRVRLNFRSDTTQRPDADLYKCWAHMLGEEYLVPWSQAQKWIIQHPQFVADFLNSKGWQVTPYETPVIDDRIISAGYVVENPEELFLAWKLSQS